MNFYETVLLIIISATLYFYLNLKKKFSFFEKHRIPFEKPNWLFGNFTGLFLMKKNFITLNDELYEKFRTHKFGGFYMMQKPAILIRDPELIKCVLVKDFAYFQNRGFSGDRELEPLAYHLFSMEGDDWKNLRIKLTSAFTTGKMKMMFPLIKECGEHLTKVIDDMNCEDSFDVKDLMGRCTTDAIGTCAFGIDTNSLENPDSEFRKMGKEILNFKYRMLLRMAFPKMPKSFIKFLNLKYIDDRVSNFFMNIVDSTVRYREKNDIVRYDFLDLLIAMKNNTVLEKFHDSENAAQDLKHFMSQIGDKYIKSNVEMTIEVMTAQCFLFFFAGFEPSATALSFLLLELAINPKIQNRVRDEIETVLKNHNDELTYESIKEMTYTDMVIAEILRKYPPSVSLTRKCNEAYRIPDTDVVIPEKTTIIVPTRSIHHDKKYYERPEDFYPEHFTKEAKASRPHYAYIPFGEGPRVCIAERLAKMMMKIGVISMLRNFSYQASPKMKFPLEFDKKPGLVAVKNGIWLKRNKI